MTGLHIVRPENLDAALAALAEAGGGLTPIAGGTDLCVSWHARAKEDLRLLDLSRLSGELRAIRLDDAWLELGAMTTYWDVIRHADAAQAFPLLVEAGRQVGAIQIQTRGTWAGNIGNGSPAADGVPVLMAYDATVVLASATGRREVALDAYFTGYRESVRQADELIVAIRLPRRARQVEWFHKVGARQAQAITKVGVAVVRDEVGWRVTANSVAPTVIRCSHFEAALEGGEAFDSTERVEEVLKRDISPIDDIRSTRAYRSRVLARLLYYFLFRDGAAG